VVWTLVLPALIEEFVQFVPSLEFEYGLKLQFDDLKVLGNDVSLGRSTELVYSFRCSTPKPLAAFAGFQIVLSLFQSVLSHQFQKRAYALLISVFRTC
jgi:hypothetical protein